MIRSCRVNIHEIKNERRRVLKKKVERKNERLREKLRMRKKERKDGNHQIEANRREYGENLRDKYLTKKIREMQRKLRKLCQTRTKKK